MNIAVQCDNTLLTEVDTNQRMVREMVMESYQDMRNGKGRECKNFFEEIEGWYVGAKL